VRRKISKIEPLLDRTFRGYDPLSSESLPDPNQAKEARENIEVMKQIADDVPIFPSIRESEQFKRAIRYGQTLADLGFPDLQYPFEEIAGALQ